MIRQQGERREPVCIYFQPNLQSPHKTPASNSSPEVTPFILVESSMPSQVAQVASHQNSPTHDDDTRPVMSFYSPGSGYTIRGGLSSEKVRPYTPQSTSNLSSPHQRSQGLHLDPQPQGVEPPSPQYDDHVRQDVHAESPPSYRIVSPLVENPERF